MPGLHRRVTAPGEPYRFTWTNAQRVIDVTGMVHAVVDEAPGKVYRKRTICTNSMWSLLEPVNVSDNPDLVVTCLECATCSPVFEEDPWPMRRR
jgi:hypothetical protein